MGSGNDHFILLRTIKAGGLSESRHSGPVKKDKKRKGI